MGWGGDRGRPSKLAGKWKPYNTYEWWAHRIVHRNVAWFLPPEALSIGADSFCQGEKEELSTLRVNGRSDHCGARPWKTQSLGVELHRRPADALPWRVAVRKELDQRVRPVAEVVPAEDRAMHGLAGLPVHAG